MTNCMYTNPIQKRLLQKWGMLIESGTKIEDRQTKIVLAQVLDNTFNELASKGLIREAYGDTVPAQFANDNYNVGPRQTHVGNASMGLNNGKNPLGTRGSGKGGYFTGDDHYPYSGNEYGDYYLPMSVFPMLRRILPDLLANELVSVQALNSPVGFAMAFRPQLGEHGGMDPRNHFRDQYNEIGYNPTDTRWTGKNPSSAELSAQFSAAVGTFEGDKSKAEYWLSSYSGVNNGAWWGEGQDTSEAEWKTLGYDYPTVTFGLTKSIVEAKTRKLAAHWSPELGEDMKAMHGIDVDRQMTETLTYEVGAEIDRQLVSEMTKAAVLGGAVSEWTPISADGLDQMGRLGALLTQITIEANNIALRTKRGNANFCITTPRVCALLSQMGLNKFTSFKNGGSIPSVPDTGVGALTKIGYINDDQQLLIRDAYTQAPDSDYLTMGYRGKQLGDSGLIYMPYIPLQLQKIMQPDTFSYSIGARTRYGIMNNPWEAKNYYAYMKITGINGQYTWGGLRQFTAPTSPIFLGNQRVGSPVMPGYVPSAAMADAQ